MLLSNLLKAAAGACPFCHQKASVLSRSHSQCRRTYDAGFQEMVSLAAEATRTHSFDEKTRRLTLAEIAKNSYGDGTTSNLRNLGPILTIDRTVFELWLGAL